MLQFVSSPDKRSDRGLCFVERLQPRRFLSATTIDVDDSARAGGDGSSRLTPLNDLQAALLLATSGSEIHVAQGTYKPTAWSDRSVSFDLTSGVSVLGGYAGFGAANPDTRDVSAYLTTLSGDIGAAGNSTDNSYHIVAASNLASPATLDGFTLTLGGSADQHRPQTTTAGASTSAMPMPSFKTAPSVATDRPRAAAFTCRALRRPSAIADSPTTDARRYVRRNLRRCLLFSHHPAPHLHQ